MNDLPAPLLRVPEAAALLGVKPSTLYRWLEERRIEVVRLGRSVRLHPEVVERLMLEGLA